MVSTNSVTVTLTVYPSLPSAGLRAFPLSPINGARSPVSKNPSYTYDIYLPPAYSSHGNPLPIFLHDGSRRRRHGVNVSERLFEYEHHLCGHHRSRKRPPWIQELPEMYAVALDYPERVLFDPPAEFVRRLFGCL